ncbi:NEL-type E3 ubiquitin ligase domain-containing protein [Pseudomonas sp. K1(2024)]|uniref:RING-type E3 ubiquitin transferase n=1 Tax=Pseudomonas boreofloridensis TaxID=3064348 RepID=A0ABV4ZAL2_9PSED|nr:NEL-type E3 ubiquitin ligase domain-containing protein [Pseudomonas sp. K13]MDO7903752.1 NEL-type E3 ubiquitin ligase domain-containing protein [Pseudomonas sp. K13]
MTHAIPPSAAHQDWIIGRRLPNWLATASIEQVQALQDALSLSLYFHERARALLAGLRAPDAYAAPLLSAALEQQMGRAVELDALRFRVGTREPVLTSQPIGYPVTKAVYREISLLEAALRNFSAEQAEEGGQLEGNRLLRPDDEQAVLPTAAQFAQLCREVDVGGQYQAHVDQVLQPDDHADEPAGAAQRRTLSLLARAHRYGMLADAHVARLRGHLSEQELQLVVQVCSLTVKPTFQGCPVQTKGLQLLGTALERIVVLDVRDESLSPLYTSSQRVLVHIPGDPHTPWSAFPNLRYFANDLGKRLRTADYQAFFSRFVRRRQANAFFNQLVSGYAGVSDLANIALEEHMRPLPEPLFDQLAQARIAQIKDDAAMIAVPVKAVDEQVQREHDQRLASEGWALLNLAGFFVPVIGLGLLAVTAWELLGEVYHGVEAWREGDTSEALDHLLNVAGDVAAFAVTAAGVGVVRGAWSRSRWVDELLPATLEDGSTRLWHEDLSPWRDAPPAEARCDEQGLWRHGDRTWVQIDEHHYPVRQRADLRWQLLPHNGHGPLLEHNGAGAWRLWWEQPLAWDDPYRLCRRLGGAWARLDDQQLDEIMQIHGLDAAQLRALHADGRKPPAVWQDSVERYDLDRRIRGTVSQLRSGQPASDGLVLAHARRLPGAADVSDQTLAERIWAQRRELFEQLYEATQPSDAPAAQIVRRQFTSLHSRGAAQVLNDARAADRERLLQGARVPLALAEAAREMVRQIRVARVLEALYLDASQDADLARVVLHLLGRSPGPAAASGWRLYEHSLSGPTLLSIEAGEGAASFDLVHLNGRFQLAQGGHALGERGELFEVIAHTLDESRCTAMGLSDPLPHNLRVHMARLAARQPGEIQQALGLRSPVGGFRPPQRLADGRLGYPLSGRGARHQARALYARVRALYPNFSDSEVENWLISVRAQGLDHNLELQRLGAELDTLREHLAAWTQQAPGLMARAERSAMRDALMAVWRRQSQRVANQVGEPIGYRLALWGLPMHRLPDIPAQVRFSHVVSLNMTSMSLEEIPESFMNAFTGLQSLALNNNALSRLPANIEHLPELRELDLYGNQIVLDPEQAERLGRCTRLQRLNLSFNPLGRVFSVAAMPRLISLQVRATSISELPSGLFDHHLLEEVDLRNNLITRVPDDYYRVPLWVSGAILLAENPLESGSANRLRSFMRVNGWLEETDPASGVEEPESLDLAQALDYAREGWMRRIAPREARGFGEAWDALQAEPGSQDYLALLARLRETRDYRTDPTGLGSRVAATLQAAQDHAELRQELFDLSRGLEGCDDAVIGRFSDLEVHLLVWRARCEAERGAEESALLYLGRQLWRLDELDRIIAEDLQSRRRDGGHPDEVEVGLAYRLGLRDEFDLPGQPATMSYREVAGVGADQLDDARARLHESETDEAVAQSMVWKSFWRTHLLRSDPEGFERLDQRFHSRLQVIEDMAEGKSYDQVLLDRAAQIDALQQRARVLGDEAQALGEDSEARVRNAAALAENARQLQESQSELAAIQDDSAFAEQVRALTVSADDHENWLRSIGRDREAAWDARILAYTRAALAQARPEPQPGPSHRRP